MTKTRSTRFKENGSATSTMSIGKMRMNASFAGLNIMGGIFAAGLFFVLWLFAWNDSITKIVLIQGIDMAQVTWVNILIDPIARGAAVLHDPTLYFLTTGILAIIIYACFFFTSLIYIK